MLLTMKFSKNIRMFVDDCHSWVATMGLNSFVRTMYAHDVQSIWSVSHFLGKSVKVTEKMQPQPSSSVLYLGSGCRYARLQHFFFFLFLFDCNKQTACELFPILYIFIYIYLLFGRYNSLGEISLVATTGKIKFYTNIGVYPLQQFLFDCQLQAHRGICPIVSS